MKEQFENLIKENIKREGADVAGLLKYLSNSDFYTAPASTKYHLSREGGLVEHSINVFNTLKDLVKQLKLEDRYNLETVTILGLLHDISKVNYYTTEIKNRKVYSDIGSKLDSNGRYDWESYVGYTVKQPNERLLFGSNEENSYYILSHYLPLTREESAAILNQSGGIGESSSSKNRDLYSVFNAYPIVTLLHTADLIATYILESME